MLGIAVQEKYVPRATFCAGLSSLSYSSSMAKTSGGGRWPRRW